ncbi:MAG: hypothetical protein AVDCRST_MAG44-878 [uncultured Sphingomonas sp.]|uniref:Uncharacterized protein n=1 Tax=uncultured Sphingomonas sp. TaxID=158754 RepID=A0A6J4SS49_9SPHN|nr:MAG: hypothetical protein AVDCRST_MAG44-878 [uncultured Sphingomonas sp.]
MGWSPGVDQRHPMPGAKEVNGGPGAEHAGAEDSNVRRAAGRRSLEQGRGNGNAARSKQERAAG